VRVEGDFTSNGNVVIGGDVQGSVKTAGDLCVQASAKIHANVEAKNANIAGEVRGNLSVQGTLDLAATSRIDGDIAAETLIVVAGAQVNGAIRMPGSPVSLPPAEEERETGEEKEEEL
jgi:cytoskeletal protein CcmA (bactofilin family)